MAKYIVRTGIKINCRYAEQARIILMNNKEYTNTAVEVLSCQNCIGGF
jgi:hypothetical protein